MDTILLKNDTCQNVFRNNKDERQEEFTRLWVHLINMRENELLKYQDDLQTNPTLL